MAESMRACSLLASHPNERWNPRFRHRSTSYCYPLFLTVTFPRYIPSKRSEVIKLTRSVLVSYKYVKYSVGSASRFHVNVITFWEAVFLYRKTIMRRQRNAQRSGAAEARAACLAITLFAKSRKAININRRIVLIYSVNPRRADNYCWSICIRNYVTFSEQVMKMRQVRDCGRRCPPLPMQPVATFTYRGPLGYLRSQSCAQIIHKSC